MAEKKKKKRAQLSRDKVFETAVELADEHGVEALTMRKLAQKLGVEAMSLYHHVADKEAILDGMVEIVFAEIPLPDGLQWRAAMEARADALRAALLRHPWAVPLLDSRANAGPATLKHQDWVLGSLYGSGFSAPLAANAAATLDSFIYGFVIQEIALPFDGGEELEEIVAESLERLPDDYPNLARMAQDHVMQPGYAFANEFAIGLALILDGFERARKAEARSQR